MMCIVYLLANTPELCYEPCNLLILPYGVFLRYSPGTLFYNEALFRRGAILSFFTQDSLTRYYLSLFPLYF